MLTTILSDYQLVSSAFKLDFAQKVHLTLHIYVKKNQNTVHYSRSKKNYLSILLLPVFMVLCLFLRIAKKIMMQYIYTIKAVTRTILDWN